MEKVEMGFRPDYMKEIKLNIQVIPHIEQATKITGNWWTDPDGTTQIRVSRMGDIRAEILHIVHEIGEWAASVIHPDIMNDELTDAQDEKFLDMRSRGELREGWEEPGFHPECMYSEGHHIGTGFELILCPAMGMNWIDYDNRVREVSRGKVFDF